MKSVSVVFLRQRTTTIPNKSIIGFSTGLVWFLTPYLVVVGNYYVVLIR